jgi:hypothetical protein
LVCNAINVACVVFCCLSCVAGDASRNGNIRIARGKIGNQIIFIKPVEVCCIVD